VNDRDEKRAKPLKDLSNQQMRSKKKRKGQARPCAVL
jgi:hypothetical protein